MPSPLGRQDLFFEVYLKKIKKELDNVNFLIILSKKCDHKNKYYLGEGVKKKVLGQCPVCAGPLLVTGLTCERCGTKIVGKFQVSEFYKLSADQMSFVKTFLRCRGNIKEIERELGISYPTVKNRLNQVIEALGFEVAQESPSKEERLEVLKRLEDGGISFREALDLLAQRQRSTKGGKEA